MEKIDLAPWEPEETVGKLWHAFASRLDGTPVHDGARVDLASVQGRLAVLFRGLGGDQATEIRGVGEETSHHRLSFLRRLGTWADRVPRASYDGGILRLPESLATFPDPRANAALYLWLATAAVGLRGLEPPSDPDPMRADLQALEVARQMTKAALTLAPGFRALHADLCALTLSTRPRATLPPLRPPSRPISAAPWATPRRPRRCPPRPPAVTAPSAPWRFGPTCASRRRPRSPPPRPARRRAPPKRPPRANPAAPGAAKPTRPSGKTASSCTNSKPSSR